MAFPYVLVDGGQPMVDRAAVYCATSYWRGRGPGNHFMLLMVCCVALGGVVWYSDNLSALRHPCGLHFRDYGPPESPVAKRTETQDAVIPSERIERAILLIRGQKVMLDADLATLYSVETGQLIRAVKRNVDRFPSDFAFQLTQKEFTDLKCQIGISSSWGGRRKTSWVFSEQGVAMFSSVLRSRRAAHVNIQIMRTFVRLREILATHADLARRLDDLEQKYDKQFAVVFDAIRQLMARPKDKRHELGYHTLTKKT
jgi:hypothetical protein